MVNRCPAGHHPRIIRITPAHLRFAPMYGVTKKSMSCGHQHDTQVSVRKMAR